nr:MAG TPA: NTP-PPase-like protein [Caudoviricetes sp.]
MNTLEQLHDKVIEWAQARNLIDGSTPEKQFLKLMEESGELARAAAKQDMALLKDSIGDCAVVSIIMMRQLGAEVNIFDLLHFFPFDKSKSDVKTSMMFKLAEELGMLAYNLNRPVYRPKARAKSALVEYLDALFCVAYAYDVTIEECLALAYDEIKDRKGKMVDGVFIKEE